jgi:hypothetical protein
MNSPRGITGSCSSGGGVASTNGWTRPKRRAHRRRIPRRWSRAQGLSGCAGGNLTSCPAPRALVRAMVVANQNLPRANERLEKARRRLFVRHRRVVNFSRNWRRGTRLGTGPSQKGLDSRLKVSLWSKQRGIDLPEAAANLLLTSQTAGKKIKPDQTCARRRR